jgi:hypothetical protein
MPCCQLARIARPSAVWGLPHVQCDSLEDGQGSVLYDAAALENIAANSLAEPKLRSWSSGQKWRCVDAMLATVHMNCLHDSVIEVKHVIVQILVSWREFLTRPTSSRGS